MAEYKAFPGKGGDASTPAIVVASGDSSFKIRKVIVCTLTAEDIFELRTSASTGASGWTAGTTVWSLDNTALDAGAAGPTEFTVELTVGNGVNLLLASAGGELLVYGVYQ